MILLLSLFAVAISLVALAGIWFIEPKWIRTLLAFVIMVLFGFASFQVGKKWEYLSISGNYNRPYTFIFSRIVDHIEAERPGKAAGIAEQMIKESYIATPDRRKEHSEKLYEISKL